MIRRPPRYTPPCCRRQRQMCIRDSLNILKKQDLSLRHRLVEGSYGMRDQADISACHHTGGTSCRQDVHRIALRIAEHISIFHGKRPFQAVLTVIIKVLDHIADQHRTVEGDKPAVTAEDGMKIRNVAVACLLYTSDAADDSTEV